MYNIHGLFLSKEAILNQISEKDIFHKYLGIYPKSGQMYANPLRKDNNPGCLFFKGSYGKFTNRIIFHDFAFGESYDCFSVVMKKYNLNFWESLKKINEDFSLNIGKGYSPPKIKKEIEETIQAKKSKTTFEILSQEFSRRDLKYWKQYGIKRKTLVHFKVKVAKAVYINQTLIWRYTPKNPIFYYEIGDQYKFYRPFESKNRKWLSNTTKDSLQGYEQLPIFTELDDVLIITKSMKDVMVLYELGYNAVAPNSESSNILPSLIDDLRSSYRTIFILYDNDEVGRKWSEKQAKKYDLIEIKLPDSKDFKDISDYYRIHRKQKTLSLLNEIITIPDRSTER